jgi:hypothetical protein
MARKRQLRRMLHARIEIRDHEDLRAWANRDGAGIGDLIRDMIRRERIRREWAERDNMIAVENANAERAA